MTHIPFVETGPYPARAGNRVALLVDGVPAFRRICDAVDAARHSVWVTVTFLWTSFEMPDGRGSALEFLARAAARGVDVRIVFWRPDDETASLRRNAFWGAPEHRAALEGRGVSVRWDRAQPGFCQHQKSWLVDNDIAFVGGINLNPHSVCAPGHGGEGQNHDAYVEIAGPSVADVRRNFIQRWNDASERHAPDGVFGPRGAEPLTPPAHEAARASSPPPRPDERRGHCGPSTVMIQRTAAGERAIFTQYLAAIAAARDTIYIENQYVEVAEIVDALHGALERGVEIVLVLPAVPELSSHGTSARQAFHDARAALGRFPNFTLAGIAGRARDGRRTPIYVHAKLMIVDDVWATVGSANLHRFSLFGNSEMNAAIACPQAAKAFRAALFREHLDMDTSKLDARAALRLFHDVAFENRRRHAQGDPGWRGLAIALEIAAYGRAPQF